MTIQQSNDESYEDEDLKIVKRYFEMLFKKKFDYNIIDSHALSAFIKRNYNTYSSEAKTTAFIFSGLILLIAVIHFLGMLPIRLIADIKYTFRDFLKRMDQ